MKRVKEQIKTILDKMILTPIKLSIPVKKVMVFESFSDYSDNSKLLFDYLVEQKVNDFYKMVWLVEFPDQYKHIQIKNVMFIPFGREGALNKVKEEIRNVYLSSRCAYYFYTHRHITRTRPKKNQVFFNLTHGLSLKDTRGKLWPYYFNTYTAVTSDFAARLRAKSYDGGINQMKITGFPRNDLLLREREEIINHFGFNAFNKTVLWMPTFRRQKRTERNDVGTDRESDIPLIQNSEEWDKLNELLTEENIRLIIKPHPAQKLEYVTNIKKSHIQVLTNDDLNREKIELYELIGHSSALISDYSSVYIDYLLTNKPIGFTVDDMGNYSTHLGFSVENPLDYMPGDKLISLEDLMSFLTDLKNENDSWKVERERVRDIFHFYKDDRSSKRIVDMLDIK